MFTPNAHPVAVGLEVTKLPGGQFTQVDGEDQVGKLAISAPDLYTLDCEGSGLALGRTFGESVNQTGFISR